MGTGPSEIKHELDYRNNPLPVIGLSSLEIARDAIGKIVRRLISIGSFDSPTLENRLIQKHLANQRPRKPTFSWPVCCDIAF